MSQVSSDLMIPKHLDKVVDYYRSTLVHHLYRIVVQMLAFYMVFQMDLYCFVLYLLKVNFPD